MREEKTKRTWRKSVSSVEFQNNEHTDLAIQNSYLMIKALRHEQTNEQTNKRTNGPAQRILQYTFYECGNKTDFDVFMVNWPLSIISTLRHICAHNFFFADLIHVPLEMYWLCDLIQKKSRPI